MVKITRFGALLWDLMIERQLTLDELCEDAAQAGCLREEEE